MSATSEEMQGKTPNHNAAGRFKRGNQAAKAAAGTPKRKKPSTPELTTRQAALRDARAAIELATPKVIETLRTQAIEEGNTQAASLLLRHGVPLSSAETFISGMEDAAHLNAEARVRVIGQRVASGELAVEHGRMLADLAQQEIQAELVAPLRRLMLDLRSGLPAHDALQRLAGLADQMDALEHVSEPEFTPPVPDSED